MVCVPACVPGSTCPRVCMRAECLRVGAGGQDECACVSGLGCQAMACLWVYKCGGQESIWRTRGSPAVRLRFVGQCGVAVSLSWGHYGYLVLFPVANGCCLFPKK